jgi:soluble lytic murein transglycosylase-like protein
VISIKNVLVTGASYAPLLKLFGPNRRIFEYFGKDFPTPVDLFKRMKSQHVGWLIVSALITPLVSIAGQDAAETAKPAGAPASTPVSSQAVMESLAQKQRQATLAAMQASVDKQRASASAAMASAIGKQGSQPASGGNGSFFNLPPLIAPAERAAASFAMPESTIADVDCEAVPEANIAPDLLGAAQREGLEPKLLTAVIQQESAFRPCAISQKGAQGLMQLMPDTAGRFGVKDPFDAKQSIDAGAKYLKELLTRYSGNVALALGAYNAGPDKVDQAGGVPPIPETTAYVNEILGKLGLPPAVLSVVPPAPVPPQQ